MLTVLSEFIYDDSLYFRSVCSEHTWRWHKPRRLLNMDDLSEILE